MKKAFVFHHCRAGVSNQELQTMSLSRSAGLLGRDRPSVHRRSTLCLIQLQTWRRELLASQFHKTICSRFPILCCTMIFAASSFFGSIYLHLSSISIWADKSPDLLRFSHHVASFSPLKFCIRSLHFGKSASIFMEQVSTSSSAAAVLWTKRN